MTERKSVDWEGIEAGYRAGQLSNRLLADKFGVSEGAIRKKAKAEGWSKDLAEKVRQAVRTELVRSEVRTPHASDREIVEQAAATGAQVVRTHRRDIRTASELVAEMLDALRSPDLELPKRAGVIRDLSGAMQKLVTMERQAYNLDEQQHEEPYEARLKRLMENAPS